MALFSIFTGLIYNEFFSIVMTLFGPTRFACATDRAITDPDAMMMDHALCPSAFTTGLAMAVSCRRCRCCCLGRGSLGAMPPTVPLPLPLHVPCFLLCHCRCHAPLDATAYAMLPCV